MDTQTTALSTGATLEYSLTGPERAPALMFVHGLGPNLHQFEPQVPFFSRRYRVLVPSLRGHGGSSGPPDPSPEDYSLEAHAADLLALMEHLGVEQVDWVGNSAGGVIGFEALRTAPERLHSLTTFGATAELHSSRMTLLSLNALTRLLGPARLGRMARASTRYEETAEKIAGMFASASRDAVLLTQRGLADYDYTSLLQEARLPMLLIQGEYDQEINQKLDSTLEVLQHKRNYRWVELPGAGHFCNLETPAQFNQVLISFLNTL